MCNKKIYSNSDPKHYLWTIATVSSNYITRREFTYKKELTRLINTVNMTIKETIHTVCTPHHVEGYTGIIKFVTTYEFTEKSWLPSRNTYTHIKWAHHAHNLLHSTVAQVKLRTACVKHTSARSTLSLDVRTIKQLQICFDFWNPPSQPYTYFTKISNILI